MIWGGSTLYWFAFALLIGVITGSWSSIALAPSLLSITSSKKLDWFNMGLTSIGRLFIYIRYNWLQILLIVLSIYDLRIDIRILIDFFTFSTLFYTISEHPLAITILITSPSLLKIVNKSNDIN